MHSILIRHLISLALVAVATSGCAYIGQSAFEAKENSLDQDGDGAPLAGENKDCDDNNKNKTPGAEEIPYDGWDNDCDGSDIIDIDGDGFAGIDKEEYLAKTPEAVWPSSVDADGFDCVDDPAINDQASLIFPGTTDEAYDGIDRDCLGDNDFDDDLDGYLPDTFDRPGEQGIDTRAAYEAYVAEWGLVLPEPVYGDCDDFDSAVNPGRSVDDDVWYDGVDQNCDGVNDFDQDGDGYMPDRALNEGPFNDYIDKFLEGNPSFPVMWGDCLDEDDAARPFAFPAAVFPGNTGDEIPYDGIDSDCSCDDSDTCRSPEDNDFDQDKDGYMPDTAAQAGANPNSATYDEYVAAWGYSLDDGTYGDCNDTDDGAYPGALEIFGDLVNSDCSTEASGANDITPFGFGDMLWQDPRPPIVDATDSHYILVTSAEQYDAPNVDPAPWVGVGFAFERTSGYKASTLGAGHVWQGGLTNPHPLGARVDLAIAGDTYYVATNYSHVSTNFSYAVSRNVEFDPLIGTYHVTALFYSNTSIIYEGTDVDLSLDQDGTPWTTTCADSSLHVQKAAPTNPADFSVLGPGPALPPGVPGGVCFWNDIPDPTADNIGHLTLCDTGVDCVSYEFDPVTELLVEAAPIDQIWAGNQFVAADLRRGWHQMITPVSGAMIFGPATSYALLQDAEVLSFDTDWRDTDGDLVDDTLYIAAVIDRGDGPTVVLQYGDPDGVLEELELPFEDPTRPGLIPAHTSIHTDDNRLFLAVSGSNPSNSQEDAIGWIFLGWP